MVKQRRLARRHGWIPYSRAYDEYLPPVTEEPGKGAVVEAGGRGLILEVEVRTPASPRRDRIVLLRERIKSPVFNEPYVFDRIIDHPDTYMAPIQVVFRVVSGDASFMFDAIGAIRIRKRSTGNSAFEATE